MSRFSRRLTRDLNQIADQCTPVPPGWEQIMARIDEGHTDTAGELVVLEARPASPSKQHRAGIGLAAVAGIAVLAVAVAALVGRSDDPSVAAGSAKSVVVQYVDAFNDGDVEQAMQVFAANAALSDGDDRYRATPMSPSLAQWEALLTWYAAQEARISDVECNSAETSEAVTIVRCRWEVHDAATDAIDRPGDQVNTEWAIGSGKVSALDRNIRFSEHPHTSLVEWISSNHPDDYRAVRSFPYDLSIEDARRSGELLREHAPQWAVYFFAGPSTYYTPAD